MSSKNNPPPKNKGREDPGEKAEKDKRKSQIRERLSLRIPPQLKERLYEEAHKTGRGITDIAIEQLWKRYQV